MGGIKSHLICQNTPRSEGDTWEGTWIGLHTNLHCIKRLARIATGDTTDRRRKNIASDIATIQGGRTSACASDCCLRHVNSWTGLEGRLFRLLLAKYLPIIIIILCDASIPRTDIISPVSRTIILYGIVP